MIDAYSRCEEISPALAVEAGYKTFRSVWQRKIAAVGSANDRGRSTAFIGYEWTSLIQGRNTHRVVICREALKRGLQLEARLGTNPYKFGMIGSTDSHTSPTTTQERAYTLSIWYTPRM